VYQAKKYIWKRARFHRDQPWCLTVSLTHPHDPYAAKQEFWDMYEGVDIPMPQIDIKQEDQDPHSKRLLQVMDLAGKSLTEDEVRRARRGYAANISYVDSKVGELLEVLKQADLLDNTIIVFSGDHGASRPVAVLIASDWPDRRRHGRRARPLVQDELL
jgi:choline-sulfatase